MGQLPTSARVSGGREPRIQPLGCTRIEHRNDQCKSWFARQPAANQLTGAPRRWVSEECHALPHTLHSKISGWCTYITLRVITAQAGMDLMLDNAKLAGIP